MMNKFPRFSKVGLLTNSEQFLFIINGTLSYWSLEKFFAIQTRRGCWNPHITNFSVPNTTLYVQIKLCVLHTLPNISSFRVAKYIQINWLHLASYDKSKSGLGFIPVLDSICENEFKKFDSNVDGRNNVNTENRLNHHKR